MLAFHASSYGFGDIAGASIAAGRSLRIETTKQSFVHCYANANCAPWNFDGHEHHALDPACCVRQPGGQGRIERRWLGKPQAFFIHAFDMQRQGLEGMFVCFLDRVAGTYASWKVWKNDTVTVIRLVAIILHNKRSVKSRIQSSAPQFDATLPLDRGKVPHFKITIAVYRDSYEANFGRMSELAVGAFRSNLASHPPPARE
jgi:hypothetical protein